MTDPLLAAVESIAPFLIPTKQIGILTNVSLLSYFHQPDQRSPSLSQLGLSSFRSGESAISVAAAGLTPAAPRKKKEIKKFINRNFLKFKDL